MGMSGTWNDWRDQQDSDKQEQVTMKNTVTLYDFRESFRQVRPNNFSYEGLEVLFDGLTEIEENCDTEIEFDDDSVLIMTFWYDESSDKKKPDNYLFRLSKIVSAVLCSLAKQDIDDK